MTDGQAVEMRQSAAVRVDRPRATVHRVLVPLLFAFCAILLAPACCGPSAPVVVTATPSPGPAIAPGAERVWPRDGSVLVYVPAGEFTMGSDDGLPDEQPAHRVVLDAFWIDRTEVTNAQWRECVEAGVCSPPLQIESIIVSTLDTCYDVPRCANQPVVSVTWTDADTYCRWLGKRLPTEAEWEKAARGTDGRTYPWGDAYDDHKLLAAIEGWGRHCGELDVGLHPEGASPYGALDMAGNVYEWVADWYAEDYYRRSPTHNPPGPEGGQHRVVRGGAWISNRRQVRCAWRGRFDPQRAYGEVGFRCASDAP